MREPIVVPDLGMPAMSLSVWYVKTGEVVHAGDRLVELLLASATFDVLAGSDGILDEQCAQPQDRVTPGQVVGFLETDGAG